MARVPGCEAVYDVANQWRQRCLESDGSLLWPDLDEPTWTLENLQRAQILVKDLGERRIAGGLTTAFASESTAVKRVLADTVAVWNLFPGELLASTRTEFVERFASQAGEGASLNLVRTAIAQDIGRFERRPFRPGLQMNRIYHLAFFLLFSIRYKQTETLSHDQTAMIALLKASSKEVPGSKSGPQHASTRLVSGRGDRTHFQRLGKGPNPECGRLIHDLCAVGISDPTIDWQRFVSD
ncbi:MAG: hypothetical protein R2839_12995 [Thermomicrobiales bacterium]